MDAIGFGPRERPTARPARVRAMHAQVRGALDEPAGRFPAGTPYAADDPELLLWILATLVDSACSSTSATSGRSRRDERDAYWQDYRVIGSCSACRRRDARRRSRTSRPTCAACSPRGDLYVEPRGARARHRHRHAPAGAAAGAPAARARQPDHGRPAAARVRRLYGFRWDPVRAVAVRGGAEYVRRLVVPVLPDRVRLVASAASASRSSLTPVRTSGAASARSVSKRSLSRPYSRRAAAVEARTSAGS